MKPTNEILKAALEYQQHGYSIIPILPGAKNPPVKWMNRCYKSADECPDDGWKKENPNAEWGKAGKDQILKWWKKFPKANVAISVGKYQALIVLMLMDLLPWITLRGNRV